MSKPNRLSAWQLVKIPALITLVVTIVRLAGELLKVDAPLLFGTEAGGGFSLIGITWLVPIFGLYFGWRRSRTDPPARAGASLALQLFGVVVLIGGVAAAMGLELALPANLIVVGAGGAIGILFAWRAWPALLGTTLLYGVLARLPVVLITFPAALLEWNTHYDQLPEGVTAESVEKVLQLAGFQVAFWIPFTVVVGGLFGSIAAWLRRSKPSPQEP